jgi:hypothetical protein
VQCGVCESEGLAIPLAVGSNHESFQPQRTLAQAALVLQDHEYIIAAAFEQRSGW